MITAKSRYFHRMMIGITREQVNRHSKNKFTSVVMVAKNDKYSLVFEVHHNNTKNISNNTLDTGMNE